MSQRFELVTHYQPTGDQPSAIAKLIDGLEHGKKEQTLLGVTGSGKSVIGDSAVHVKRNGVATQTKIGMLVDELFANNEEATQEVGDTSFINASDVAAGLQLETIGFDSKTGASGWRRVTQISRHIARNLLAVRTTCGREVVCTTDHNFFAVRDGNLELTSGSEVQSGDWLPVPLKIAGPQRKLEAIDLVDHIHPDFRAYCGVFGPDKALRRIVGAQKYWRIVNDQERMTISDYRTYRSQTSSPTAQLVKVGTIKRAAQIPARLCLTDHILRFIGYYVAEGCTSNRYVTISTGDQEIVQDCFLAAKELGVSIARRLSRQYDYVLNSSLLVHLLEQWCGSSSNKKRLPSFWPQLNNSQLGNLLSAYFAGDGGVEAAAVTTTTVSPELASDLQYALLRFGIVARCREKKVLYQGGHRAALVVSISGAENLAIFYRNVGFSLARKQALLIGLLGRRQNTNVDLIPINGAELCVARRELGVTQAEIAKLMNVERSYISMLESGVRLPSRSVGQKLLAAIHKLKAGYCPRVTEFTTKLDSFLQLYWTPIKDISYLTKKEYVYDFAVEDYETFLTGRGGLFVHNTFTMANIVAQRQVPTLVMCHNKTLAAQLYSEFKQFFPDAEVHYFVSYFDYYQPEAYIPSSDVYIEKDSKINEEIDRLRHAATSSLLTRRDTLIVASVSCIYGIGSVEDYGQMAITIKRGERRQQDKLLRWLSDIQYQRNDIDFHRSTFRVRGDVVDVFPAGGETAYRIEFSGDDVERITNIDSLTGEILKQVNEVSIFPGSHYVTPRDKLQRAIGNIKQESEIRVKWFEKHNKLLEAQRLKQRTKFDVEMLEETGFVKGIENYSRYLTNRQPGEQPATLMDYFPDDFLLFVDESHMTLPQVRGMYNGDRARKEVLVDYGFRLPSALDNRPLTFTEFERQINQVVYVSATPAEYELSRSGEPVQQVIRPTGLLDPQIEVRKTQGQIDDLIAEIKATTDKNQRVLVTTLTKRMAEDLTDYLVDLNIKTAYLHSDVDTLERTDILRDLRLGVYDVLVGINLLREGLDLPEVSLVAIIDADKEGFLRSAQALIQTVGRAARHQEGRVIMYADSTTKSMQQAIDETNRRRVIQETYNTKHSITPSSINKSIDEGLRAIIPRQAETVKRNLDKIPKEDYGRVIKDLTAEMELAAANLQFETAAELRDLIAELKAKSQKGAL